MERHRNFAQVRSDKVIPAYLIQSGVVSDLLVSNIGESIHDRYDIEVEVNLEGEETPCSQFNNTQLTWSV